MILSIPPILSMLPEGLLRDLPAMPQVVLTFLCGRQGVWTFQPV